MGVVLILAPWNYPLLTTVNALIPAILAGNFCLFVLGFCVNSSKSGNSVIIKHSPRTPLCADHFEKAFLEAGAPVGLVKALHTGNAEVTKGR